MRILVGNSTLDRTGGTQNYTYALAMELKRQGHAVEYFTFAPGLVSTKLEQQGIPFMQHDKYDLILANHIPVCHRLKGLGYIIQTIHGPNVDIEQPSVTANAYVAISQEIQDSLKAKGYDSTVIENGIDCERFKSTNPLNKKIKYVLSLCQSKEANDFIHSCCKEIGIKLITCNKNTDNVWEIEKLINKADLVIGIGRSLYDAMACGRCVLSFDIRPYLGKALGDGYLNSHNIEQSVYYNCSGRGTGREFTKEMLIEEIQKYNYVDGEYNRAYALKNLNIKTSINKYIQILPPTAKNSLTFPNNYESAYIQNIFVERNNLKKQKDRIKKICYLLIGLCISTLLIICILLILLFL